MISKIYNMKTILLVTGAVAFLFSSGKWNAPVMAWIWPFCFLYFERKTKGFTGILIPCIVMILLSAVKWYGAAGSTVLIDILAGMGLGLVSCIPFIIDWLFSGRVGGFWSTLVFPLTFAAEEFVMQLSPTATVGPISATQTGNDPLMQAASVFGSYGVSFLVTWAASAAMYVIDQRRVNPGAAGKAAFIYAAVLVGAFIFGGIRLALADPGVPDINVALSTGPWIGDFTDDDSNMISVDENIASMQKSVRTAAGGKADIVLFCEEAFSVYDTDKAEMLRKTADAAAENGIYVLLGLDVEDTDDSEDGMTENVEYLFDDKGQEVWEYNKSHLTMFVEPKHVVKGDGIIPNKTVTFPSGKTAKLASVICMDSDFPTYVRDRMDNDAGILLVPTWDWPAIRAFHTKWVELRAVENGVSFVRSCMDGTSTATDQYGRVIMHADTAGTGYEAVSFAQVPAKPVFTVYKYLGPVIDWGYIVLLLLLILSSFLKLPSA